MGRGLIARSFSSLLWRYNKSERMLSSWPTWRRTIQAGLGRSWWDGSVQPDPSPEAVRFPYVRASLLLEHARAAPSTPVDTLDPLDPGLLMLLPLLRSRHLLVNP